MNSIVDIIRMLIGEYEPIKTVQYIVVEGALVEQEVIAPGLAAWNLEYIMACLLVLLTIYAIYNSFKWTFYVLKKSRKKEV